MDFLLIVLAVAVVGVTCAVALGRISGGLSDPVDSQPALALPETEVKAADVDDLRFPVVMRGYRMSDVDQALDLLKTRIQQLEKARPAVGGDVDVQAPAKIADTEEKNA